MMTQVAMMMLMMMLNHGVKGSQPQVLHINIITLLPFQAVNVSLIYVPDFGCAIRMGQLQ